MNEPHPVLEHPLSANALEKEPIAGQLVSIYSDYFDETVKAPIELKELQLDAESGLFSVTYYTAMMAMRLLRDASTAADE